MSEKKKELKKTILETMDSLRIVLGYGGVRYDGWIHTDKDLLDMTRERDWQDLFQTKPIDILLSEHVLEHIDPDVQFHAVNLCYRFLKPGGLFRLAVPDGYRPDDHYRNEVLPPKDGHTMIFTYLTLENLLQQAGFQTTLLEYFDENGVFQMRGWDPEQGMIRRSARFDTQDKFSIQNGPHTLNYTSLIIDAVKP